MSNWLNYYVSNKRFLFSVALLAFSLGYTYYGCLSGFFYSILPLDPNEMILRSFFMIFLDSSCLFLLVLILAERKETLKDLGFSYQTKDISRSIILFVSGMTLTVFITFPLAFYYLKNGHSSLSSAEKYFQLLSQLPLGLAFAFSVVNPLFEELITRAYLMTELEHLFHKAWLSVILCALIQAGYHLYQGWIPTFAHFVTFLFFSLYYQKTKRIMPLVLAHFYMDFFAIFGPVLWPAILNKVHTLR
jgi:membrane protease YdiL (CAAX protease family)